MAELTIEEKAKLAELLSERDRRVRENRIELFKPYPYQKKFYAAGAKYKHRLLMAANRIGKSYGGAAEVTFHATGLYPDDWEGRRYDKPVKIIAGGQTTERTRDISQKELLGEPSDPAAQGTGAIPKHLIMGTTRRAGIPNAISSVLVKHVSGKNSKIMFNTYEAGKKAWMGDNANLVWLDEEPPEEIYTQALRAIVDLDGDLMMTFTPENGVTNIVKQYMQDLQYHQYLQHATWDDAPHITASVKEQILKSLPQHERDMRSKGIPVIGSGLVFGVMEESITCDPFQIPDYWRRISGIDFGYDHATAWVDIAIDPDSGCYYVVQATKVNKTVIPEICSILKKKGANKVPVAWPHDGLKHDPFSGKTFRDMHEQEGLKMLPDKFSNPPSAGAMEGSGGNGIEAGIAFIHMMMDQGLFKVFRTQEEWFQEFRLYHRKEGKIVDRNDDLMAATRYAACSARFAIVIGATYGAYIPPANEYADGLVAY